MSHPIGILVTGCLVYAATNVDDLLLLVAFLSHPEFPPRAVVIGQFVGMGALVAAALAASGVASLAAPQHVGLLGFAPIGIGLWRLRDLRQPPPEEAWATPRPDAHRAAFVAVAVATISDGGDNLAAYVPWFTALDGAGSLLAVILFAALTGLWCAVGLRVVGHPRLGSPLRRIGRRALPIVMIGLGVIILVRTGAVPLP